MFSFLSILPLDIDAPQHPLSLTQVRSKRSSNADAKSAVLPSREWPIIAILPTFS